MVEKRWNDHPLQESDRDDLLDEVQSLTAVLLRDGMTEQQVRAFSKKAQKPRTRLVTVEPLPETGWRLSTAEDYQRDMQLVIRSLMSMGKVARYIGFAVSRGFRDARENSYG